MKTEPIFFKIDSLVVACVKWFLNVLTVSVKLATHLAPTISEYLQGVLSIDFDIYFLSICFPKITRLYLTNTQIVFLKMF